MNTKQIGDFGETIAEKYLLQKGYKILKRNFDLKVGEIDIIAKKDGCIVFAEVKTRRSNRFGEPSEYVDYRKQMRIKKTASCYADMINDEIRFDVIEVFYEQNGDKLFISRVNHIENAF